MVSLKNDPYTSHSQYIKMNEKRLLNKRQVAEYLGFKIYTIDAWVSQRRIPYIKIGTAVRFDLDEIEAWLKERKVEPIPFQAKRY
jgi:excisionase family DNA binding protein